MSLNQGRKISLLFKELILSNVWFKYAKLKRLKITRLFISYTEKGASPSYNKILIHCCSMFYIFNGSKNYFLILSNIIKENS